MLEKPYASRSDPAARRAYTRWHYQQNKAAYKARAKDHRRLTARKIREYVADYLSAHPCVDCGEADPVVLEFDHRRRELKLFAIGNASHDSRTLTDVVAEIKKCDVRCANCHRRKTYREQREANSRSRELAAKAEPLRL